MDLFASGIDIMGIVKTSLRTGGMMISGERRAACLAGLSQWTFSLVSLLPSLVFLFFLLFSLLQTIEPHTELVVSNWMPKPFWAALFGKSSSAISGTQKVFVRMYGVESGGHVEKGEFVVSSTEERWNFLSSGLNF